MEELITFYTGSIATISLIIEVLKQIDDRTESWSLKDKVNVYGFEVSWLKLIGAFLSIAAAIWLTLTSDMGWLDGVAGAIAIFFTQYGAGKIGWRNVVKLIFKIKGM